MFDPNDNDDNFLVRQARAQGEQVVWGDAYLPAPEPQPKSIPIEYRQDDLRVLTQVKQTRRVSNIIQVDFFILPSPMRGEKGQRPYFVYMLLMVEAQSGMILGNELLQPLPTLTDMWGKVPTMVATLLARHQVVPQRIAVRTGLLATLLDSLAKRFDIQVEQSGKLRALNQAKNEMLRWMERSF